ncbi:unnamed protein product, partial [Prorocentrum cordatum]
SSSFVRPCHVSAVGRGGRGAPRGGAPARRAQGAGPCGGRAGGAAAAGEGAREVGGEARGDLGTGRSRDRPRGCWNHRGSSSIARPATLCWRSAARGAASLTCRAPRQRSTPRRCRCGRGAPQRCRPAGSRCRARSRGAPRFATGSRWRAVAAAGPCPGRAAWTSWRRTRDLPSTRPGSSGRGTWPSWGSGLCWRQAAAPLPSGRGQGCRSDSCSGEASWLAHSCCGLREMFLFYTSELCSKVITVVVGTCLGSKSMSW